MSADYNNSRVNQSDAQYNFARLAIMNVASELAKDPQVILYFLALGWSIFASFKRTKYLWQIYVALAFMSLTWFYIMRWKMSKTKRGNEFI